MMTEPNTPLFASTDAPIQDFAACGLSPPILRALALSGYIEPTPIQQAAIPPILAGKDVMGAAQTGTGKTASFALPIIERLLPHANNSTSPARHPVRALILTPTRELASQVAHNIQTYSQYTLLKSAVVFGGVDISPQKAQLRLGIEIVIATPGRLLDLVTQQSIQLNRVDILVMDEADRMLDMGFLPDLQKILSLLPLKRQSLMFSATFSPEIKKLAATFLRDPMTIAVAKNNATAENVTQLFYEVAETAKAQAIYFLLTTRPLTSAIIFTNTKNGATKLARYLASHQIKAAALHGDKTQTERMAALAAFKAGELSVLVATDVAARGLDIAELPCVINADLPYSPEDYVHRIGRTGRAQASGEAISLVSSKEIRQLADIEKLIQQKIACQPLIGFDEKPIKEKTHRESLSHYSPPKPVVDPWFLKPYEPVHAHLNTLPPVLSEKGALLPKPKKRATLLGGGKR